MFASRSHARRRLAFTICRFPSWLNLLRTVGFAVRGDRFVDVVEYGVASTPPARGSWPQVAVDPCGGTGENPVMSETRLEPVIYGVDVGSIPEGGFGWTRIDTSTDVESVGRGGSQILELADDVADDLLGGRAVALGFESPLFVPVPGPPQKLGAARQGEAVPGEQPRPWSAAAGAAVLPTGVVQSAWILDKLNRHCPTVHAYVDWAEFETAGQGLFLWEAFVTAEAKAASHIGDATLAAKEFQSALPDPTTKSAVRADNPLSLIGAALLWSGWCTDVEVLHQAVVVIKVPPPDRPTAGERIIAEARRRRTAG